MTLRSGKRLNRSKATAGSERQHEEDLPSRPAMEARSVDEIPEGSEWQYEPKWDGFRCILTRDGKAVAMLSKSGQDLKRYFPEIVSAALSLRSKNFVLDGELVVPVGGQFSFDDLLQRIHPAASRVKKLRRRCIWRSTC